VNNFDAEKTISLYRKQITASQSKVNKITRSISDWQKNATLDMEQALQSLSYLREQNSTVESLEREAYQTSLDLSQQTLLSIQRLENEIFISEFLLEQLDLLIKQKYPTLTDKIVDQTTSFLIYVQERAEWMRESFFKIGNTPITFRAILKVIAILILGYAFATFVQKLLHRLGKKHNLLNESALYTFSRLAYFFILLLGLVIAISSIGIDFTAFAFIAGAFTFWIGFGLLSIIQNFVSGIIVLLDKNIRVGDYIVLESGEKGIILDVNVRTTILETLEGHKIFIPNSELIIKKFTNKKISDQSHRISIPFKISYQADRELVCKMAIETAVGIPYTLPVPPPQVWMTQLNDSNIDLALVMWVDESSINKKTTSLESIYLWAIDDALRKNKISL
jgi:small-conductance mechanosensitive channel